MRKVCFLSFSFFLKSPARRRGHRTIGGMMPTSNGRLLDRPVRLLAPVMWASGAVPFLPLACGGVGIRVAAAGLIRALARACVLARCLDHGGRGLLRLDAPGTRAGWMRHAMTSATLSADASSRLAATVTSNRAGSPSRRPPRRTGGGRPRPTPDQQQALARRPGQAP
jgi:hypothetical protein